MLLISNTIIYRRIQRAKQRETKGVSERQREGCHSRRNNSKIYIDNYVKIKTNPFYDLKYE